MNLFDPNEAFKNIASEYFGSAARHTKHKNEWHRGTFENIARHIPGKFIRVPFSHDKVKSPFYDTICNDKGMPLSIVSKSYFLINHADVVDSLKLALEAVGRSIHIYPAELYIGDHGAQFGLRVILSDLLWEPRGGDPISGSVELLNSVDKTLPFRLTVGYFRFICSNGLYIGKQVLDLIRIHVRSQLQQLVVERAMKDGLVKLDKNSGIFRRFYETEIPKGFISDLLINVRKAWGKSEAMEIDQALEIGVYRKAEVPGVEIPVANLWDIYNVLTWISSRSQDLKRQLTVSQKAHEIWSKALRKFKIGMN